MALVVADRVKETTTTTGTGTYTLAGAVTGFESFASIGNSNTTYYCCTDGTDFEVGIGTYASSGTTLARTTILQSSNSDSAVNWSSGTRDIFCTQPAEKAVFIDGSGDVEFASGQTAKFNSNGSDPVIDIDGGGPNFIRFRDSSSFSNTTNAVDIKYRTSPNDLLIETSGGNIMAEFGGDDGHAALYFNDAKKLETLTGGVDITGNITVSGTVDGRDLATDGSKLDGIEASADVTDTTNVTAAGALMDSEVTNLAQVKAFDSSDYATAAQGSTADAALPKAGGTMTGNLELNNANIVFEGSTADADETTLTAIDPTEDRTISLPNQSGTVMVTLGDSYRSGVSQTYSGSSYLVDGEFQTIATVTPSGSSHNYFFSGRIIAQSGQNVHTLNITVALRSNTLPDLSFTANYDEDVVGTVSQYITPVLYTKETSPASFILAVEVHATIYGTLTADLDFFARTQADLADISVNTTDGSEITSTPSGYTLNQFTKTTALDNGNQFVFNQDVQFTGDNYNVVWDKSDDALEFADEAKAVFGAGGDLEIYHSSNINRIEAAQQLYIKGTNINLYKAGQSELMASFQQDGPVELYYDAVKKLETASDGINVTGDVTLTDTDTGSAEGPLLILNRDSSSPANSDVLGHIKFKGDNDAGENVNYAGVFAKINDDTDGTEDGLLELSVMSNGSSSASRIRMQGNGDTIFSNRDVRLNTGVDIRFEGATSNANETILTVADPTADHTITLPDATGTVQLTDGSGASLTSLNASELGSGTVPNARLDAQLQDVAGLAVTNGNFIVGDGANFVAESGSTARTSLGLGTAAVLDTGISNTNIPKFTSGVVDDDFLRVNGTDIEGRSASEVLSDIAAMPLAGGTFTGDVTLQQSDDGSSEDPQLILNRVSSSPADDDTLGTILFRGRNDAGEVINYAKISSQIADASDGTEDGYLNLQAPDGGSLNNTFLRIGGGEVRLFRDTLFLGDNYTVTWDKSEDTLEFADNAKLAFGAGDDISLHWDGTDGHLAVAGTLNIEGSGETLAKFIDDGAVELYHNNSKKLETASGGISVTGEVAATSLDISGDVDVDGTLEADAMTLNGTAITTTATLSTGISNGNVPVFTSGVADDDFLRVNGTSIEGRSASEVVSDLGLGDLDFGLITGSAASSQDYGAIA